VFLNHGAKVRIIFESASVLHKKNAEKCIFFSFSPSERGKKGENCFVQVAFYEL
jgi:hypothetical protein